MLRSLPSGEPKGRFSALSTRDGEARLRDGQDFYDWTPKGQDHLGVDLFEIRFGDGLWMLATADDIRRY